MELPVIQAGMGGAWQDIAWLRPFRRAVAWDDRPGRTRRAAPGDRRGALAQRQAAGGQPAAAIRAWLAGLDFEDPASRTAFTDYLVAVSALERRPDVLEEAIEGPRHAWARSFAAASFR